MCPLGPFLLPQSQIYFFQSIWKKILVNKQISKQVINCKNKFEWFQFGELRMIHQICQTFPLYGTQHKHRTKHSFNRRCALWFVCIIYSYYDDNWLAKAKENSYVATYIEFKKFSNLLLLILMHTLTMLMDFIVGLMMSHTCKHVHIRTFIVFRTNTTVRLLYRTFIWEAKVFLVNHFY